MNYCINVRIWLNVFILTLFVCLSGCSNDFDGWQTVSGHDISYSAKMPDKPTHQTGEVPVPQGRLVMHVYELITDDVNYTIGCCDYPEGFLRTMGKNAKEIFDGAQQPTVQKLNATILEQQDSFSNGFPKRSLLMRAHMQENASNMEIRQDLYLVKGRLYSAQTLVFEERVEKNRKIVDYFHDSFEFDPDQIQRSASVNKVDRPEQPSAIRLDPRRMGKYDPQTGCMVPVTVVTVPDDARSIQQAIDLVENGDVILVKPGLYRENLYFDSKNIKVFLENPDNRDQSGRTVIQGFGRDAVLTFSGKETKGCIIRGFVIDGSHCRGGTVALNGANPSISDCQYIESR